jgi:endonuclease/exonuclease/phosphatase family metal-dependent hydrolase
MASRVLAIFMPSITLLTINIHKGLSALNRRLILPQLRATLRATKADVVCLQEVTGQQLKTAEKFEHYPSGSHVEYLADSGWTAFAYGQNAAYEHGHHGNAILSKFPIIHTENRDVSIAGPERRGLLHCELRVGEARLHVICVHLSLLAVHRSEQLRRLCRMMDEKIPPRDAVVVAGDFNDWRHAANSVLKSLGGFEEVYLQANGRLAKTFPARFPMLGLDRIYVRNLLSHAPVTLPVKPWSHLSDHAPLAAQLVW